MDHAKSRLSAQHSQYQLQRSGIVRNPQPLAATKNQFDGRYGLRRQLGFHQRKADRRALFPQPLPPAVKGVFSQILSLSVGADRLPTRFLLPDPFPPLLPKSSVLFTPPLSSVCRIGDSGVHVMDTNNRRNGSIVRAIRPGYLRCAPF
jgi:hypothetical protein